MHGTLDCLVIKEHIVTNGNLCPFTVRNGSIHTDSVNVYSSLRKQWSHQDGKIQATVLSVNGDA